ncbi:MAG: DUF1232 domain-containing protein [Bacteroidota bacterium]
MKEMLKKYQTKFSETKFWEFIKKSAKRIGVKTSYTALLLYYAYKRKETPAWARRIIIGALGYLIVPADLIVDLKPFIGFYDDVYLMSFTLVTIASFVNAEVRSNAKVHLAKWFSEIDPADLESVDKKL